MLAARDYEGRYSMDGETNGSQEATQGQEAQAQEQQQEGTTGQQEVDCNSGSRHGLREGHH